MRSVALLLFICVSIAAQTVEALEVALKNGDIVKCERAWRKGDTVFVQVNPETIIEFGVSEVASPKFAVQKKGQKSKDKKVLAAVDADLPEAPDGYSWVKFADTKSAFLKPDGWFVKKGKQGETWGYCLTKEDINKDGHFKTGLTVNVIPNIPRKKGIPATQFASSMIEEASKSRKIVKEPWTTDMGPFQGFGVVVLNKDAEIGDFMTHNLAIGNDSTGTAYLIIFEAPASSWKSAWHIGEPILKRFLIDSDI